MSSNLRAGLTAIGCLIAFASPDQGLAQQSGLTSGDALNAPAFDSVDVNGVDLLTGYLRVRSPMLSMGDESSPSAFYLTWSGQQWLPNTPHIYLDKDWHVIVEYDGISEEFADGVQNGSIPTWGDRFDYTQKTPNTGSTLGCYWTGGLSGNGWLSACFYQSRQGVGITFYGMLPYSGGYPSASRHDYEAYGNTRLWPGRKSDPAKGATIYLTESPVIGNVTNYGNIKVDSPDGFLLTKSGKYNDPTITFTLSNKSVTGASRTLTVYTSNLSPNDDDDTYLRPKSVTQTFTDPLGRVTSYTFNSDGDITQIVRPSGVTATIGYDNHHRVTSYTTGGLTWTYSYNFAYNSTGAGTTTATNPLGVRYVSHLKKPGPATTVVDELGRTTSYTYDSYNRLTLITYPELNSAAYHYDARGNVDIVTVTPKPSSGQSALVTTATFETGCASRATCNKPLSIDGPVPGTADTTNFTYDASGLPATITEPVAPNGIRPQTRNTYAQMGYYYKDSSGNVVQATDRLVPRLTATSACQTLATCAGTADEVLTTLAYGFVDGTASNNLLPISTTNKLGTGTVLAAIAMSYDAIGNPVAIDGPLPGTADTTYKRYDAMRQLLGTISPDPDGGGSLKPIAVQNTYNSDGQTVLVETGNVNGSTDTDWAAFVTKQRVATAYDSRGRPIKVASAGTGATLSLAQTSYDALNRPVCSTVRMNSAIFPTIGAGGALTGGSVPTDACSLGTAGSNGPDRITKNVYDAAGQLVQIRKAVGTTSPNLEQAYATYSFTPNGKQEYVIDAKGSRAKLAYDGFDRQTYWYFPSTTLPTAYNPATQATALASAGSFNASDYEQYAYDATGNRTSLRKRDGQTIAYTYDALNRMTLKDIPGGSAADVYYAYDNFGLQTYARFGSASGLGIITAYDGLKRIVSSTNTTGGASRALGYQYDAAGNRTRVTHPDGQYFTYEYDPLSRLTGIRENGTTQIAGIGYDLLGRRNGLSTGNGLPTNTLYDYDDVGRMNLLSHNVTGSSNDVGWTFTHNSAGQVLTRQLSNDAYVYTGDYNVNRPYAVNGLNQYTSAGTVLLTYSPNGNLATQCTQASGGGCESGTSITFTYDVENRLVSASGAKTAALSYDPSGRLLQTSGGSAGTTQFLHDGDQLVGEYDGGGALLRRYVHGSDVDEPLAWYEGAGVSAMERRYLLPNWQGSVIAVTDSSGTPIRINSYDAYGIPHPLNLGRFQYTGQIRLPELGMYHYKSRLYSPTLGRFLQTDPIGYEDQMNLYAYVANDPVNKTDPTGLYSLEDWQRDSVNYWKGVGNDIVELGSIIVNGDFDQLRDLPPVLARGATAASALRVGVGEVATVAQRANQVHSVLDPIAQSRRTTAVLETSAGRIVAGGGRDLTAAQRGALGAGETAARAPGAHAEVTALRQAAASGATPRNLATTRPICANCAAEIRATGGRVTSPTTATWGSWLSSVWKRWGW